MSRNLWISALIKKVVVFFGYEGRCINKSHNAKPLRLSLLRMEIHQIVFSIREAEKNRVKKSRDSSLAMTDVCF